MVYTACALARGSHPGALGSYPVGDIETLRAAQAAVGACVFILVFFGTYRPTRSRFACWWGGVVAASAVGSAAYLLGEFAHPTLAASVGNGAAVMGAAFAWVAARSLRGLSTRWWLPVGAAMASALATWWENPQGSAWPGGLALLLGMGGMLGLSAWELAGLYRTTSRRVDRLQDGEARTAIAVLTVASVFASVFYGVRVVAYLTVGPDAHVYTAWVGPRTTTFLVLLLLVVVSYTVTALSHFEVERGWKTRALTDDLTGMLNRSAFLDRAHAAMEYRSDLRAFPAVVVADIDHFKDINDRYGHAYGDRVLVAFSKAVRATLGESDFAARFGGEEFVLFIAHADGDVALTSIDAINSAFESTAEADTQLPTVSYGVAALRRDMTLESAIHLADAAMYRAKRAGRAQAAVHDDIA